MKSKEQLDREKEVFLDLKRRLEDVERMYSS